MGAPRGASNGRAIVRGACYALGGVLVLAALGVGVVVWLVSSMPGRSGAGAPLDARQRELAARLESHVSELALEIGPRHRERAGSLDAAADFIEGAWRAAGHAVRRVPYERRGEPGFNLELELLAPRAGGALVIAGAHYDTVFESPGADDNASGVAALIELARSVPPRLAQAEAASAGDARTPRRGLRLLAFADEEGPYELMGSHFYAQELARSGERVAAMLSIEMIGHYRDEPGSQSYPIAPLSWIYPERANFIAFVGNLGSRELVRECVRSFRGASALPSEGVAAPELLGDIRRSDHASFWAIGAPALMVTDTSNFRYAHYHQPSDLPEQLDFSRMAQVVDALSAVLSDLASRSD